jgi:hypothetical protein
LSVSHSKNSAIRIDYGRSVFMRTVEDVLGEITALNGQDAKAAFEKFLEVAGIGRDSGNDSVHVLGLLNAAALACKMGNYDLCIEMSSNARDVNEEIWTKYLEEPHMQEMLKTLSEAGVFG